ncbi:unnamed protein product [Penicillium olsonii]|nr:unnamed protein product [Penicillium olsonii]
MELGVLLAALAAAYVLYCFFRPKAGLQLPPGPRGMPIIGNLLDLPPTGKQEWQHWLKHKTLYGPLSSISIFGTTLVIINDRNLALEILEKRSAKHSSRPDTVFADEIDQILIRIENSVGWGKAPSSQDNTSLLRQYRKAMARIIGSRSSMSKFDDMLEVEARRFLWRVLNHPKDFVNHTRTAAGAFILKITYGYNIEPHLSDPLVSLADLALQQFSASVVPGAWLVDMIPFWAGFKKTARFYAHTLTRLVEEPFAFTKSQMADEKHNSFTANLLQQGEDEEIVKWSSVALYSAGADTTVSALQGFYLAMMLHPEVQRKAQAELDQVLGKNVFPSVADRDRLPYINAVVKEALRWHTVAPLGLPHKTDQDDVVNGHLIPKGALLLANIWSFNNDSEAYNDPTVFNPERFLLDSASTTTPDPYNVSFGFGRRLCPGRLVADISLFLTISHTLAVFNITKPLNKDGQEVESSVNFTPGIISHPEEYECVFTPRSNEHREHVLEFERNHPFEKGDAPYLKEVLKERQTLA